MVLIVLKQFTACCRYSLLKLNKTMRFYSKYDPPYLKQKEYEIPIYPILNIQLTGYKYPILESYQAFIHKVTKVLDITVVDSFAFPHREYKIKRFKPRSTLIDSEYNLKMYERDIQVSNLTSIKCPIFIRILEATLPEGVTLHIDKYDPELQKKRIIPNKEILDLKSKLDELQNKAK